VQGYFIQKWTFFGVKMAVTLVIADFYILKKGIYKNQYSNIYLNIKINK